jgi:1-phosphofructokinase family hexose kinase
VIHLVSLNPALDISFALEEPTVGKIGKVLDAYTEPGGKALNLGRFLKKFKTPSLVWLGTGGGAHPTHVFYRALLAQEKLKVNFLSSKAPVRFNLMLHTRARSAKYNHAGFETELTAFSKFASRVKKNDLLVLTGKLTKGVNESLYASWIAAFNKKGVKTIVDAAGKPLLHALKAKPWFFKSNLFEISEALGQPIKNLKEAEILIKKNWLKASFRHGALTDGSSGAIVWKDKEGYIVQAPPVSSALVVGAGDGFLAGYLKGVNAGKGLKESAVLAGACGTAVAESGIQGFNSSKVSQLLKRVKVRRVL